MLFLDTEMPEAFIQQDKDGIRNICLLVRLRREIEIGHTPMIALTAPNKPVSVRSIP